MCYVAGQSPRRLMTGFMLTTMFLSMWISNTAATAMMVPIVDAVLQQLYKVTAMMVPIVDAVLQQLYKVTAMMVPIVDAVLQQLYQVNIPTLGERNELVQFNQCYTIQ